MVDPDSANELYGLDVAVFTAARDALAKELRAGGERREADRVKKLRRPSLTAWALNQTARGQPDLLDAALDAGTALRVATRRAIDGDASALRQTRLNERRAVTQVVSAAAGILEGAGHQASDRVRMKMADTIRASFVDDDVAAQLRQGVLDRERRAAGFDLDGGVQAPVQDTEPRGAARRAEPDAPPVTEPPVGADQVGRQRAKRRAAELSAQADEQVRRLSRLRDAAGETERHAAEARQAAQEAGQQAADARQAAEQAELRAADAERRAADARTQADEAVRAMPAAD